MVAAVTLADIRRAAERIAGAVMQTPCLPSQTLSAIAGCELWLKFENLQFTASFKERGALNKLLWLREQGEVAGVVAMSAGNHAQGVAYHAARLAIPATIVMPAGTPMTKIVRTRDHGATVIVAGDDLDDAFALARQQAEAHGHAFIHPYDDPQVIAGQGTLGLEIAASVPTADFVVVPIGGGGLISGIALAVRALMPNARIIGVQSRTYPSMVQALAEAPAVTANAMTIAEGIAVKSAGRLTRRIVADLVDEVLLVEEASMERAVALLQSVEKTVVEGAGAAALALILEQPARFAGRRVVAPLTGGNIDPRMFAGVIMRDLVRQGQLARLKVPMPDHPGALAKLATILGNEGANIVDVEHGRLSLALNPKGVELNIVVQLHGCEHGEAVLGALSAEGFVPQFLPMT